MQVANEHFKQTALAQRFRLENLDWFFNQWVYQTHLPSYRLEYRVQDQADGSALLTGTLYQENVPESWGTLLPVTMNFGKDQIARVAVAVSGRQSPVNLRLPRRPSGVQLDPDLWILSEKTTTREVR
jgi:aminopeptidase N